MLCGCVVCHSPRLGFPFLLAFHLRPSVAWSGSLWGGLYQHSVDLHFPSVKACVRLLFDHVTTCLFLSLERGGGVGGVVQVGIDCCRSCV